MGCYTKNKRGYISCGSVQVEGTSPWLFKENKGGYIPCGSLLVKDFTRLLEISRTGDCLGTRCRHGLFPNQYKSCVCHLLPYTFYFSTVYFYFRFTFV